MTSSNSWICDGTPKNGEEYPGLGEAHQPHENYSLDCEICGLPKESWQPGAKKGSGKLFKMAIPIAVAGIVAVVVGGGAAYYTFVMNRCDLGLEKIDGQCIDPFLQPYQEARQQGYEAISIAKNYQTMEDLKKAQTVLVDATNKLNQIPTEASIYPEVETTIEQYQQKETEINSDLTKEETALEKLAEVETIAKTAEEQTEKADNTALLNAAKQKWQEARNKLQEIDTNTLVANGIQQYQSNYDKQITSIDERIASIAKQNRPRLSTNTNYRPPTAQRNLSTRQNKVTQPQPQPQAVPADPCAVVPKPDYCRF